MMLHAILIILSIFVTVKSAEFEESRKLIGDTGSSRSCFDTNYYRGYADYLKDPFKANNNRGDWGKCIPEQLFHALCVHEAPHALNTGTWKKGDGPLHDDPAEQMFLKLKNIHNDFCLHVDVKFTSVMQEKLNDYLFARNIYALPVANDTVNTFSFDVTVKNGAFVVNGNVSPVLRLLKGYTYSFFITADAYAAYPFTIGTSVGTPFTTTKTTELLLVKILFTIPFDGPSSFVYFSTNNAAKGNSILLKMPTTLTVVPKNGYFYLNGQKQPTLTIYRGKTYTFTANNADMVGFPFAIGSTLTTPFAGTVTTVSSYSTSWTVTVTDLTTASLVYYCTTIPSMAGVINVVNAPAGSRRLATTVMSDDTVGNCTGSYSNPRLSLQMSLYCMVANLKTSLPPALTQKPYKISATCDKIVRNFMSTQVASPVVVYPNQFCNHDPLNGVDACTVNVYVGNLIGRTCKSYCESFQGLTCGAASISYSWFYRGFCMVRRPWGCSEPLVSDDKLICTCVQKDSWNAVIQAAGSTSSAVSLTTSVPSKKATLRIRSEAELNNINRMKDEAYASKRPSMMPTFRPTLVPTTIPTKSPISLNSNNKFVSTSCLKLMVSTDLYPPLQLCRQNLQRDSCTVIAPMYSMGGSSNRTCSTYCQSRGLQCVSAFDNWGCYQQTQRACNATLTNYYSALCECGQKNVISPVVLNPDVNTKTCQQIAFYGQATNRAAKFCPSNLITSTTQDSCTVSVNAYPYISCGTFCKGFPGLKCLYGTFGADDGTCSVSVYGYLGCDVIADRRMLCTCGVDTPAMAVAETKKNESLSTACLNLLFQPLPYYQSNQICTSDLILNTCTIAVPGSITCNQYCSSFPGMQCIQANAPNNWMSCQIYSYTSAIPQPTCDSDISKNFNSILCQCGFIPGAPQQNSLQLNLFADNLAYCPAYPDGLVNNVTRRRLDDWQDGYNYKRYNKKVTLEIDYDSAKADGSAKISSVTPAWDLNDWTTDTYNTGTPEMCTGLVSLIRPGDPPEKCSFGHRPYNSAAYNCYGKLYSMKYSEASEKCAARGGRLAKVDTLQKFNALLSLFKFDNELAIGLHDIGGRNWRWDGESNVPVNRTWFNATVPFYVNDWSDDCIEIYFRLGQGKRPTLTTTNCRNKKTYLCEGIPNVATPTIGGDLLADEGGFCIWYYSNPVVALPDDQSGNFQNTELAHFLLYEPTKSTNKYEKLYDSLYTINNIVGQPVNKPNWEKLTRRKVGQNSDSPVFPIESHNYTFHCHFSPTNFGVARIFSQQHMLERLYTGSAHQHCFCGYKYLGNLVDRCDCTRSGEQSNQCLTEHKKLLYDETYAETGEYVSCNNCNNPSP